MGLFSQAMSQPAQIETQSGVDSYGDPSYSAPTTIMIRLEQASERVVTADGQTIDYKDVIYSEQPISELDRITLDTGYQAVVKTVNVSKAIGLNQTLYKAIL